MTDITTSVLQFRNPSCPFTELFSLLKRSEQLSNGDTILGYEEGELRIIQKHIDNAMVILLHGMQDIGGLLGFVLNEKIEELQSFDNIGFFISGINNLMEALNGLRNDTDSELQEYVAVNH